MTTHDPDSDVMDLVQAGDIAGAISQLMQRYGTAVHRYCQTALNDPSLAEDIQQQVFIEAFRDLPKFAGRSTLRTWLLGIARHRVLDAAKARRRAEARMPGDELAELAAMPDPGPSPAESLGDMQLRQALLASLGDLGEDARITVLLRYQLDCSFGEIARICGESPGAHHARVVRALRQLRKGIQSRIDDSVPRPGARVHSLMRRRSTRDGAVYGIATEPRAVSRSDGDRIRGTG